MIESNPANDHPRRRSQLLNTLSISDPLPNGPENFDAAAFTAHTLSSPRNLAAVLDHTLLKPDATRTQVLQLCHEAVEHRFASAMVNPPCVAVAAAALTGTAPAADIALLRGVAGHRAGVNAPGGIRSPADATTMLHAGASRIGASASVKIVTELAGQTADHSAAPPGY